MSRIVNPSRTGDGLGAGLRTWFRPLARVGYVARGIVYAVIGFFAALAAIGSGEPMGSHDALMVLLSSNAGFIIGYALAAGFLFYALWRLIQAGFDTDQHGYGAKGLAIRAGLAVSGITYAALASYTWSLTHGARSGTESGKWAETLVGLVGGRWVSGGLAIILAGVGIAHVSKAVREKYARYLQAEGAKMKFIDPVAKIGLIARGAVFLVLAFILATHSVTGGEKASSKAALEYLQGLPFGWLLLSLMGIGLIAFAIYSFTEAVYRKINVEDARV